MKGIGFNFFYFYNFFNFPMNLSNYLFFEQFFYHSFHVGVAAGEGFALFGLEHDVLDGFHLGGRASESALLRVAVDVGYRPLVERQVGARLIQFGVRRLRCVNM